MKSNATTVDQYIAELPENRKETIQKLRKIILKNKPAELKEQINCGMIGYVIPHSVYPKGYHCDPKSPLPLLNLASQKNYISLYNMCLYDDTGLLEWFKKEYSKHSDQKLNMGKCCIRFTKPEKIPYDLIAELISKINVDEYISHYESVVKH